mmetsp:Transcript_19513/g.45366  ORF Transcript_19513/g.45366 Transcript_19513/m.45366 type:complete len:90 (+) Transcript_19513:1238-1507(+)
MSRTSSPAPALLEQLPHDVGVGVPAPATACRFRAGDGDVEWQFDGERAVETGKEGVPWQERHVSPRLKVKAPMSAFSLWPKDGLGVMGS